MDNHTQAALYINQAHARQFHLKASLLLRDNHINQETFDEVVELYCEKFNVASDQYKQLLGVS